MNGEPWSRPAEQNVRSLYPRSDPAQVSSRPRAVHSDLGSLGRLSERGRFVGLDVVFV